MESEVLLIFRFVLVCDNIIFQVYLNHINNCFGSICLSNYSRTVC